MIFPKREIHKRLKKLAELSSLVLAVCTLLASCAGVGVAEKTGTEHDTVKTPDGNQPGWYKWPSELLPEDFPVLCDEVPVVTRDKDGALVIAARDPTWCEMKSFVNVLVLSGWGSVAAGYVALVRESEKIKGEKSDLTDAQLFRAAVSLSNEFDGFTDENQKQVSYYGRKNGKSVFCVLDTLQRESENRFVMWVRDVPEPYSQSFSKPGCTVMIENGWTATVRDGQLYVSYDYDPSGNCLWSLSAGSGNPAELMEEYFSTLARSGVTAERREAGLTVAESSDLVSAAFTLPGAEADLNCLYASWTTADGRTWQFTASANSYDVHTLDYVIGRLLTTVSFYRTDA